MENRVPVARFFFARLLITEIRVFKFQPLRRFEVLSRFLVFLAAYVLIQLGWWGFLIIQGDSSGKKTTMVMGEGIVFAAILIFAFVRLYLGLQREISIARKEKNFMLAVSHELKTPIAAIKLGLDTLKRSDLPDEKRASILDYSSKEIRRLQSLTENILLASRLEQSVAAEKYQTVDLSQLVQEEYQRFQLLSGRNITAHIQKDVLIKSDQEMIRALFSNLIDNAIKYSQDNSSIQVSLHGEHPNYEFRIADQGIGISDREKNLIFQRFYRSTDEIIRASKGTGLGLHIVKSICQLYQFRIRVENNTPNGSIFTIQFKA
jgi:two-component system phosphate regulon sensor histidine kinase PhoR